MSELIKNNYKPSWIKGIIFTCIISLLFVACNKTSLEELKDIPEMQNSEADRLSQKDFAYHFTTQRSFNSVPMKVPTNIKLLLWDSKYDEVDYRFFRKFNNWFDDLLFQNGLLSLGEGGEALDCENYAMLYKSTISLASFKSGTKNELAVGIVVVRQINEFAGIPATGSLHALNLVLASNGWYIFEPQTNEFILLENYPNQEYIQYIIM